MVVLISHSLAFTGSHSGHDHAERWWWAPTFKKTGVEPRNNKGEVICRAFLLPSFSIFHICWSLPRHWTLKNSWGNILKAWHFQRGLNAQSFEVGRKWKSARLHQRATLSLLTVKREMWNLTGRNITSSFLLPVSSLWYLQCTSTKKKNNNLTFLIGFIFQCTGTLSREVSSRWAAFYTWP